MKVYKCICGKTFVKPQQLAAHKANCAVYKQANDKQVDYVCDVCGRQFSNRGALSSHMRYVHLHQHIPTARKTQTCPICGNLIAVNNIPAHINSHKNGKYDQRNTAAKSAQHLDHDDFVCKYCHKQCYSIQSTIQHEIRCKNNPNHIVSTYSNQCHQQCKFCHQVIDNQPIQLHEIHCKHNPDRKTISEEVRQQQRETFKRNQVNGLHKSSSHKHSSDTKQRIGLLMHEILSHKYATGQLTPNHGIGRGKKSYIIYNDVTYLCRSTYEFIYALYLYYIEHKKFTLEQVLVSATVENAYGKSFRSDFYVEEDNLIIEIKGIKSDKDKLLKESFEAAGYNFVELFEPDIRKCKNALRQINLDIDALLYSIKIGSDSKQYLTFNLTTDFDKWHLIQNN